MSHDRDPVESARKEYLRVYPNTNTKWHWRDYTRAARKYVWSATRPGIAPIRAYDAVLFADGSILEDSPINRWNWIGWPSDVLAIGIAAETAAEQPETFNFTDLKAGKSGSKTSTILRGYRAFNYGSNSGTGAGTTVELGALFLTCTVIESGRTWEIALGDVIKWTTSDWGIVENIWRDVAVQPGLYIDCLYGQIDLSTIERTVG